MKKGFSFKAERGALLPYCFFNSNSFFLSSDETGVRTFFSRLGGAFASILMTALVSAFSVFSCFGLTITLA